MIKNYKQFNESVRDMMKPKSEEELIKLFNSMSEVKLSVKELQGMQHIAQYYYLNNKEEYVKTDIDYHKLFVDGEHMMHYISTGDKSIQLGFPPHIEGLTISNGFTCFYVDVNSKFVGKEDDMETLIITTFQNDYREKLQVWNDMTMEDRIDDGLENIKAGDVGKWYDYLVELFDDAGSSAREILPNESMG